MIGAMSQEKGLPAAAGIPRRGLDQRIQLRIDVPRSVEEKHEALLGLSRHASGG